MLTIASTSIWCMEKSSIQPRTLEEQNALDKKLFDAVKVQTMKDENFDVVEQYIKDGADVNAKSRANWTPLYWAVENNNIEMILFFIVNGANIHIANIFNYTFLHIATYQKHNLEMILLLIMNGANVNTKDNVNGQTPLHSARNPDTQDLLTNIGTWQDLQDDSKILKLIAPQSTFSDAIKETCFSILLSKGNTKNLLAFFQKLKEFTIPEESFAEIFTNLTESEYKKMILTQLALAPIKLEPFFQANWDKELSLDETKSLNTIVQKNILPISLKTFAPLVYCRLNFNLKEQLQQAVYKNRFIDTMFEFTQ